MVGDKIGFVDKNGVPLCEGDKVVAYSILGNKKTGKIVAISKSNKARKQLYVFKGTDMLSAVIKSKKFASSLERID
jgi:hypothetical protein